jgi:hypothetical protein
MLLSLLARNLWTLHLFRIVVFLCCTIFGYIPNSLPEVQFLVPDGGMKPALASGCHTGLPAYVKLGGSTTRCHSRLCQRLRIRLKAETHTKRQETEHGCLPSLLGDREKGIEIVYGGGKNIFFCTGLTKAAKAEQKSLVPARHARRTYQGRTPFLCTL